jgi:hypothetical protein
MTWIPEPEWKKPHLRFENGEWLCSRARHWRDGWPTLHVAGCTPRQAYVRWMAVFGSES